MISRSLAPVYLTFHALFFQTKLMTDTTLYLEAANGNAAVARLLLVKGADVDAKGYARTALYYAAAVKLWSS